MSCVRTNFFRRTAALGLFFPSMSFGLTFGLTFGFSLGASFTAQAVDFKIDLPLTTGVVDQEFLNLEISDEDAELIASETEASVENKPNTQTSRESETETAAITKNLEIAKPLSLRKNNAPMAASSQKNINAASSIVEISGAQHPEFPAPKCLKENINFWERVYRDVKVNEILVHDRENLGVIFGTAKFTSLKNKADVQLTVREDLEFRLTKIAAKMRNKNFKASELNSADKKLLESFPLKLRNSENVLNTASRIRFQGGLQERFEAGIQRSLQYISTIKPILATENLPEEIIFLPHVESSYTPYAASKVGAVGLWQIMPGTMQQLLGSKFVNSRKDIRISTIAAAKLLKQNFKSTKSWPLALTAYNHGLGGMQRAMRKTGSNDLCTIIENYDSASFRFASSNFYAQFIAAKNISKVRYHTIAKTHPKSSPLKKLMASISVTQE